MRAPYRNRFDPSADFKVRKGTSLEGRRFDPGDPFDKTLVSERKLRLMFQQRTIVYANAPDPGAVLSAEEALQTHRGAHAARVRETQARRAKDKREKEAAEAKRTGKAPPKKPAPPKIGKGKRGQNPPRETVHGEAAVRIARAAVEIPADWEKLGWPKRLQLAAQLTDEKVKNGADAAKAITEELAARGTP
jgi:hypothetical protein